VADSSVDLGASGATPRELVSSAQAGARAAAYDPSRHFGSDLSYKVFLDRYTTKDIERRFEVGDVALALVVDDSQWPRKEVARVLAIEGDRLTLEVVTGPEKGERIERERSACDRPVETTPDDMWRRVARAMVQVEEPSLRQLWEDRFFEALSDWRFVPGGRILAGAGTPNLTLYNCVAAETLVHTKDGMKPIGTLQGPVEILTQGGVYRTAVFGSYGVQRLYRVLLENGDTIDATAAHEWLATLPKGGTEVVTTLDLEGRQIPIQPPVKPELDRRAVAHGLVFGDGARQPGAGGSFIDLYGDSRELVPWIEPYAKGVTDKGAQVRVTGLPPEWKELPAEDAGASYWRGFIVGLLAANGSVDTRGAVVITQSDATVLDTVRRHAAEAGFMASVIRELRQASNFGPGYAPSAVLGLYRPSVSAEDLLLPEHRARFTAHASGTATVRVVSVTTTDRVEEVYCCNEPETHTMVVGQGYLTRQCYVVPSPRDSRQGIIETLGQMIEIMSRGGGVGINVSSLRPRRAVVRGVNGRSSGAVSWMDLYSRATGLVEQGGCFGPEVEIATDQGPIAAEELYRRLERGERFLALTHEGLRPITDRFANGTQQLFRVTTDLGYEVEVTGAHRMGVVRDGEMATVELARLAVGDEILVVVGEDEEGETVGAGGSATVVVSTARTLRVASDRIVAIRASRVASVYDFEVAHTHMLAGNGVYTSNSRRGALMLMMYDWHPDLMRFIDAKRTPGMVENANVSVCISDAFMQAVKDDREWELRFPDTDDPDYDRLWTGDLDAWLAAGKAVVSYDRRPAREIWQRLTESAWASAEPGIAFLERSNKQSNSWYFHPLIATNPCVTGDTLIFTGDGLRRADELFLSRTPVEAVVDGRMRAGRTEPASPVFLTGLKPVVRVLTREGYSVRVTADHQIYSDARGWVKAGELSRGEPVRILDHPGGFGSEGTEELGQVLGYLSVAAKRRGDTLRVSFPPERQAELEPLLTASVRRLTGLREDTADGSVATRRGRTGAMVAHRLGEISYAHGLGSGVPAVPDAIVRGCEAMQRGYLQAVFEAAGYVCTVRGRPVLTARGASGLLRGVQQVLLNMGIASRLRTAKGRAFDDTAPSLLTVEREGLLRFQGTIGALSASRRGALADVAAELRRHPFAPERFVAHVESITPDGEEAVYDLTEPSTHSFVAGGIVVHNCAEQPLPAWGVCCLGHVNLAQFVADGEMDWDGLGRTVRYAVRFLDNVVDTTPYYFEENAQTQQGERRLGLGTMGLGEVLIRLGLRYGSPESVEVIDRIYKFVAHEAYAASADLAEEKGPFPYFEAAPFLESGFMQGMADDVRERVLMKGIRNVTLLTQAPTGTVGTMVGTSTGIEPFYALKYVRQSRLGVDEQYVGVAQEWLSEHPGEVLPSYFVGAMDLTPDEHVRVQAATQRWTDSAISKTANAPADYTVDDTRRLYELAYDLGCKGVTIYRDQSRQTQVLHRADEDKSAKTAGEPAASTSVPAIAPPPIDRGPTLAKRPRRMRGECFLVPTHFGNLTLDVHEDPSTGDPIEIIASAGTAGSDLMADAVALGMAASVLLRMKGPVSKRERLEILIDKFRNIGGAKQGTGGLGAAASLAQGIARGLDQYLEVVEARDRQAGPAPVPIGTPAPAVEAEIATTIVRHVGGDLDLCPSCGHYSMEMVEGCRTCNNCGFSNCS